ncbi:MAG: hypothetical protein ACI8QC_000946 [Planctomycetota bacterium]|jgi:hypothetical protein
MLRTLILASACLLAPLSAQQQTWVIDPNGAGDFLEIADALPVTGEGWTLLVKPGDYVLPVIIANQGMTIVADIPGTVTLSERVEIKNLGLQRDVILSGLELLEGFEATDCNGLVRLQDCVAPKPVEDALPPDGVSFDQWATCGVSSSNQIVSNCRAVVFVDCLFAGADGLDATSQTFDGYPGDHGLLVEDSSVALYGCTLAGGEGGSAFSSGHFPVVAGAGGDGLRVRGQSSVAHLTDLLSSGGAGGSWDPASGNGSFGVTIGCDGSPTASDVAGVFRTSSHPDLRFTIQDVARGTTPATLSVQGTPGTPVILLSSASAFWRPLPTSIGILHLRNPLTLTSLGTIPGSGVLTTSFAHPGPNTTNGMLSYHLQVFGVENGARFLSEPRRMVVVHPSL